MSTDTNEIVNAESRDLSLTPMTSFLPLPVMSADKFLAQIDGIEQQVFEILRDGKDYGLIPNTQKKTLLKPGAERILQFYGCSVVTTIAEREVDFTIRNPYNAVKWITDNTMSRAEQDALKAKNMGRSFKKENVWIFQYKVEEPGESIGLYRYVVEAKIVHLAQGTILGSAIGSCSSMETKYIRNPGDVENTILQMAAKRATVAAVKSVFGLSAIFDEDAEPEEVKPKPASKGSGSVNEGMNPVDSVAPTIWAPKGWAAFKRDMGLTDDLTRELEALAKTANQNMPNLSKAYQTEVGENGTCTAAGFVTWVKNELAPEGGQD